MKGRQNYTRIFDISACTAGCFWKDLSGCFWKDLSFSSAPILDLPSLHSSWQGKVDCPIKQPVFNFSLFTNKLKYKFQYDHVQDGFCAAQFDKWLPTAYKFVPKHQIIYTHSQHYIVLLTRITKSPKNNINPLHPVSGT